MFGLKKKIRVKGRSANSCVIMPKSDRPPTGKSGMRRRRKLARVNKKKPEGRSTWKEIYKTARTVLPFVLVACFVAGGTLGAYRLYLGVLSTPYLGLKEIVVEGTQLLDEKTIRQATSLAPGTNLLQIDTATVEERVAQHPWVQRVLVERKFPNQIVVQVEERKAAAILVDEHSFLVDETGFVFKEMAPDEYDANLLIVSGLEVGRLQRAKRTDRAKKLVRQAVALAKGYHDKGLERFYPVSQVEFDEVDGFSLVSDNEECFVLGFDGFAKKLERLEQVFLFLDKTDQRLTRARLDNEKEPWRVVVSGTTLRGQAKEQRMRHLQLPIETQEWMLP